METKNKYFPITIFALVFAVWCLSPVLFHKFINQSNSQNWIADTYTALNTLFSGLAFAGIIYTIMLQQSQLAMQKEELTLQRKELEMTRQELRRSAEAQENSEKALRDQIQKMELASRLSALSALVDAYLELSNNNNLHFTVRQEARNKADAYLAKLEEIGGELIK